MNRHARQRILAKLLPQVRSACDLACSTGETALDFARRTLRRAGFHRVRVWDGVEVRPRMPGARPGFDTYYLAQKRE